MTLILTQASHRFVIQVSDRLVTRDGVSFDPVANKTVVFRANDAVMVMSYTGDAYVGNIPTDTFIAEVLSGSRFAGEGRPGMMFTGMTAPFVDLESTLRRLERRLAMELRAPYMLRARSHLFEVLISGWEWGNGVFPRPFVASIRKEPGEREATLSQDRRLLGDGFMFASTPDGGLTRSHIEELRPRLRQVRSGMESEQLLVDSIRTVADQSKYVGPDCMSVLLPPPEQIGPGEGSMHVSLVPWHSRGIRVRFLGVTEPTVVLQSRRTKDRQAVGHGAFSPWIIGPGGAMVPSVLSGHPVHLQVLGIDVAVEARPSGLGTGIRHAMGSIDRPPFPR